MAVARQRLGLPEYAPAFTAERLTVLDFDYRHFDVYLEPLRSDITAVQTAFLHRHLCSDAHPQRADRDG